jgi:hypothetical protein
MEKKETFVFTSSPRPKGPFDRHAMIAWESGVVAVHTLSFDGPSPAQYSIV